MKVELDDQFQNATDDAYASFMDKDKISDQWILTGSWIPIATAIAIYLLVVLKLGPMYMEKREPYKLELLMRLYNVVQVIYNCTNLIYFLLPVNGIIPLNFLFKVSCSPPRQFEGLETLKYMYLIGAWNFILLKILDLLDTVFMVLRKRNSHVTFLHVYHHVAMVFFPWFSLRYIKATQAGIPVFINLCVHAVMYFYYFLATFDSFKKYLWWKRHLTKLQLAQFAAVLAYIGLLYHWNCSISRLFTYIWIFNVFVILCLFINFYVKAYVLKSATVQKPAEIKKQL